MKIVICDDFSSDFVNKFNKLGTVIFNPNNLKLELKDADVLIVRSTTKVDKDLLENIKKLKIVGKGGVGLDNVDVELCQKKGIKVINATTGTTVAVAELTISLIILLMRKVTKAHDQVKNKKWNRYEVLGQELSGKTLGIIGLGRIGSEVAKIARVMNAKVLAYDPYVKSSEVANLVSFDELLKNSDIVTIHTALTKENEKMLNKEKIAKMKNGVYLVNMSRGSVIDEGALYEALKSGKIDSAALDVFQNEPYEGKLLECENVIFTPHIGANTKEAQIRIAEELVNKINELFG